MRHHRSVDLSYSPSLSPSLLRPVACARERATVTTYVSGEPSVARRKDDGRFRVGRHSRRDEISRARHGRSAAGSPRPAMRLPFRRSARAEPSISEAGSRVASGPVAIFD